MATDRVKKKKVYSTKSLNGWSVSDSAEIGVWYTAIYLGDRTPYILKFDGSHWRTSEYKLMAIPLYIIKVPSVPVLKCKEN